MIRKVICKAFFRILHLQRILYASAAYTTLFLQDEPLIQTFQSRSYSSADWAITASVLLVEFHSLCMHNASVFVDVHIVPTLFKVSAWTRHFATGERRRCHSEISSFCNYYCNYVYDIPVHISICIIRRIIKNAFY